MQKPAVNVTRLLLVLALVVVAAVAVYVRIVPRPAAVTNGTVIITPAPSAPPVDKKVLLARAIAGDADAQCRLAGRFEMGDRGLPYDPQLALYWATLSANAHNACGMNDLGILYHYGEAVPRDLSIADDLYRAAASLGDTNAMTNLGNAYYNGDGVDKNIFIALDWYKQAADRGSFDALRDLGEIYGWGQGVPKNINRASAYLLRANPVHDPQAATELGDLYMAYYRRSDRCQKAIHWWMLGESNSGAQTDLGRLYDAGICVNRNAVVAAKWYRMAMNDNTTAERSYAVMLLAGRLGKPDNRRAQQILLDAAAKGDAGSMFALGFMYEHGATGPKNPALAWRFYLSAASLGQPNAVDTVATAYLDGTQVKQDKVIGYGMLLAIKTLGARLIPAREAEIVRSMTPSQLARARAYAFVFVQQIEQSDRDDFPWLEVPLPPGARVD